MAESKYPSEMPTEPDLALFPCPRCRNEAGLSTGEAMVELPSGTRVLQDCPVCRGLRKVDREGMARYKMECED